jgi:hypothetical protein
MKRIKRGILIRDGRRGGWRVTYTGRDYKDGVKDFPFDRGTPEEATEKKARAFAAKLEAQEEKTPGTYRSVRVIQY